MTSWGGNSYQYDTGNSMVKQNGRWYFLYTFSGERIATIDWQGSIATREVDWTIRGPGNQVLSTFKLVGEDQEGNWSREVDYIWMGRRLLGTEDGSGVKKHYHTDHLGSIRLVTNAAGNKVSEHEYLPYGQELTAAGNGVMKFTGHERDGDTGMDYMHARFYTSYLGRFMGPDSVMGDVGGSTGSWNRYQYGLGNPLNLLDPNGQDECPSGTTNVSGFCVNDTSTTVNCSDSYDPSQCAPPPECGAGTVAFRGSCRGHSQSALLLRDSKDPWNGRSRTVDLGRAIGANLRGAVDKLKEMACAGLKGAQGTEPYLTAGGGLGYSAIVGEGGNEASTFVFITEYDDFPFYAFGQGISDGEGIGLNGSGDAFFVAFDTRNASLDGETRNVNLVFEGLPSLTLMFDAERWRLLGASGGGGPSLTPVAASLTTSNTATISTNDVPRALASGLGCP